MEWTLDADRMLVDANVGALGTVISVDPGHTVRTPSGRTLNVSAVVALEVRIGSRPVVLNDVWMTDDIEGAV